MTHNHLHTLRSFNFTFKPYHVNDRQAFCSPLERTPTNWVKVKVKRHVLKRSQSQTTYNKTPPEPKSTAKFINI